MKYQRPSVWTPLAAGSIAATGGALVLLGWTFEIAPLIGPLPGTATMKPNTALSFVLAGLALLGTTRGVPSRAASLLGLTVTSIAVATLAEYAFSWDLQIDQLLFTDRDAASSAPGRMSPMTAV